MKLNLRIAQTGKDFFFPLFLALLSLFSFVNCSGPDSSQSIGDTLEAGFISPPDSAKPRVWWHWMNGNITKEGIEADLKWMNRIGIGGFQNFDAAFMTPQIVENRLSYMTLEWKDAFSFTTNLADSLGLEMAIAASPGWSESGGPWVKPEEGMKKFVWTETPVEGGKTFSGTLPHPPTSTGKFQNMGMRTSISSSLEGEHESDLPEFYQDAVVVAFKLPSTYISMSELQPKVTSSGGSFNLSELTDGDLAKTSLLPNAPAGQKSWVQYEFPESEEISSLTIVGGGAAGMFGMGVDQTVRALEKSVDGKNFEEITVIPSGGVGQKTLSFEPVVAKYYRFTFSSPEASSSSMTGAMESMGLGASGSASPKGIDIAELILHKNIKVDRFEDKAAFSVENDLYTSVTPDSKDVINQEDIVDLTSLMSSNGSINWDVPEGNWMIIRLGYSLLGIENHPASPEATGLEVDKLNADHVTAYFTDYLDQYKDATGGLMGEKGLQYVITDSWEAGAQNWTDDLISQFEKHRGYDMMSWLPVLTGYVVESSEASDRFLWDFRKTLSDLLTENHYDLLTSLLEERGMGRYSESHENGRAFIGDGMEVKRSAAVPMSATWTPGGLTPGTEVAEYCKVDVRESASVSHIYGQSFVAAESLTAIGSSWAWSPETLKPTADMELANGLNRFVIHTSVHQPLDDKFPGLGLGPFGQWFTRHETWAEQAEPWITYLSRSSYMLQQGEFIADIVYYYGEDNNVTSLFRNKLPVIPEGYNYDFVNADALVNVLSVEDGKIITPSGMSYNVLALDSNSQHMTLKVLRKIKDMVSAGAVVVGPKPTQTPSLMDDVAEFKVLADELWSNETGENTVGKGKVYAGKSLEEVLADIQVPTDFKYTKPEADTKLMFVHRQLGDVDFYWVNNRNEKVEDLEATFRVEGKTAEIWHPETGEIEQVSYSIENGLTTVPLHLESSDAVFVVFRNEASSDSYEVAKESKEELDVIAGSWNVSFEAERGAPAQITIDNLESWSESSDSGVKYFSGTATYTKTVQASADWFKEGAELWLDLGSVKNIAEVTVNGQPLGIVWKTPFRVNVTEALQQGENTIEVEVTNLWVNRLIGDQQPNVPMKYTYTTQAFYQADSPLKPSGLLGPVTLISIE